MSAVTVLGRPAAAMIISDWRVMEAKSFVPVWQRVTVELYSLRLSKSAIGFPTMLERPITATRAPFVWTPARSNKIKTPWGVQGKKPFFPINKFPMLTGWKPSTSFLGSMARVTFSSFICLGRGS